MNFMRLINPIFGGWYFRLVSMNFENYWSSGHLVLVTSVFCRIELKESTLVNIDDEYTRFHIWGEIVANCTKCA